jgi:uroporphyrinogen-III decarboxylase
MTSKEIMAAAMNLEKPERVPVMCQMANGHTIINTGVHPIDYFVDNEVWADCLIRMRELYDFDGILCHKPGRVPGIMDLVERTDYDMETPSLFMKDGSRIECTRDDDAYYKEADSGMERPTIDDLDLDDMLGWAPESFVAFQASKATFPVSDPDGFDDATFGMIDKVIERVGGEFSVHGEVRAPMDHFLNILGLESGMMAIFDDTGKVPQMMDRLTEWSIALAVAQVRRGADAIKVSSPFVGGGFLGLEDYEKYVLPFESRLAKAVRDEGRPIYTHTCGAIGDRLNLLCQAGVSGIECLDPPPLGNVEIEAAVEELNGKIFIKGNVDPVCTLLQGDREKVTEDVTRILEATRDMSGFILSSACSVAPPAPPENMQLMVELAHEFAA